MWNALARPLRMGTAASLVCGVLAFALIFVGTAGAQEASPAATTTGTGLEGAVAWLMMQQADDGGFLGFSGTSDPGATTDAVIALAAAGAAGIEVDLSGALAYLEENALVYAQQGTGQAAKLALAVAAAGGDPHDVATVDPIALVVHGINASSGLYGTGVFDHALCLLALTVAGEEIPDSAIEALENRQIEDGSWAFDGATEAGKGDSNTTAIVIQALAATGNGDDEMIDDALDYLETAQTDEGGFGYQPGDELVADANSTALAVQAIIAAGEDPTSEEWGNAAGALAAFQNPSGAYRYNDDQPDDNLFATVQAIPAAAGLPLPILAEGVLPGATPEATPAAFGRGVDAIMAA